MRPVVLAVTLAVVMTTPADAKQWRLTHEPRVPEPAALIVHAPCPDVGGACASPDTGTVYLPRRAGRFARLHELGHIYLERLPDRWKGAIMVHMGLNPARIAWNADAWGCDPMAGDICPSERAADAYAACALGFIPGRGRWETNHNYLPSRRQQQKVCSAIRRSGR